MAMVGCVAILIKLSIKITQQTLDYTRFFEDLGQESESALTSLTPRLITNDAMNLFFAAV